MQTHKQVLLSHTKSTESMRHPPPVLQSLRVQQYSVSNEPPQSLRQRMCALPGRLFLSLATSGLTDTVCADKQISCCSVVPLQNTHAWSTSFHPAGQTIPPGVQTPKSNSVVFKAAPQQRASHEGDAARLHAVSPTPCCTA